jgi:hypothetical protein
MALRNSQATRSQTAFMSNLVFVRGNRGRRKSLLNQLGSSDDERSMAGTAARADRFTTTRWSVVLSCADSQIASVAARDALGELCRTYWRPIFAFICRRGYSVEDAEDLTQDFFATLLEGPLLGRADPARGRFRSLILKALQDFLGHAAEKREARKRGGPPAIYFVGRLDGQRALAVIDLSGRGQFVVTRAIIRSALGRDRRGAGSAAVARGMRKQRTPAIV